MERPPDDRLGTHYLTTVASILKRQKRHGEGAMEQLEPAHYHWTPDPESNSIAVIVKHLAGNMRSRWTDVLTRDGEKPDRRRDDEFIDDLDSPDEILTRWEEGWGVLFRTLDDIAPQDLVAPVTIRGREYSLLEALERQTSHYAGHVGQIVYIAKHLRGSAWETLSIPRGASTAYRPEER